MMRKPTEPEAVLFPIANVVVAGRHRKQIEDDTYTLEALAASIQAVGMLHPIVIRPDGRLIVGERRLEAVKRYLHWDRIPAIVARDLGSALAALRAERDENLHCKPFAPTEAVAIAAALEPLEAAQAKKRQRASGGRRGVPGCAKSAQPKRQATARERVAKTVGMSRPTLDKAEEVAKAAAAEPETFGDLAEQMDETGKVDPAHRELRRRQGRAVAPRAAGVNSPEGIVQVLGGLRIKVETLITRPEGVLASDLAAIGRAAEAILELIPKGATE